jgi:hypothetical protein
VAASWSSDCAVVVQPLPGMCTGAVAAAGLQAGWNHHQQEHKGPSAERQPQQSCSLTFVYAAALLQAPDLDLLPEQLQPTMKWMLMAAISASAEVVLKHPTLASTRQANLTKYIRRVPGQEEGKA